MSVAKLSPVVRIKADSDFLRGTIVQGLADDATGALADDDTQLTKFHGIYQQDDRDLRLERQQQRLEPAYQFMVRVRVPGGRCSAAQWLMMDDIVRRFGNGSIRLTTRQAFQLHGVIKPRLRPVLQHINDELMDTIAACGDVNRNVMCSPLPETSAVHRQVFALASELSDALTPATRAYSQIWLDGRKLADGDETDEAHRDKEPIYGATYLPRKFKIGFAIPPRNDVDVFSQDLAFVAVIEQGELAGFNVTAGGGMGMTHGDPETYPRLADTIGFCRPEQVLAVATAIVTIQRDFGDRSDRKHARFKYTIADRGLDWLSAELQQRLGFALAEARPVTFTHTGDRFGWQQTDDGLWHLTLFVENGRIADSEAGQPLTGLREIIRQIEPELRLTPNQNLILSEIPPEKKAAVDELTGRYGLDRYRRASPLRLNSMACVGLPTCGLAMAESERYLPDFIDRLDGLMQQHRLEQQAVTLRMTGCPNGCARPYISEIGLVGKAPGRYNLYVGGSAGGQRLSQQVLDNADEAEILATLNQWLAQYSAEKNPDESFGDFALRAIVLQKAVVPPENEADAS